MTNINGIFIGFDVLINYANHEYITPSNIGGTWDNVQLKFI